MEKKKHSLMSRAVLLLLLLILPFNIIGIFTAVLSYLNSVQSTKTVLEYTLDSYVSLLENEINNTNSMLYDIANNNSALLYLSSSDVDTQYMITKHQLISETTERIRISNVADTFFVYLQETDDYIQLPGYDADTVGTEPYYTYVENYDSSYSRWFLSDDHTELVRVLYDSGMHLYYGAVIDLTDFLSDLDDIQGYDTLVFHFRDTESPSTLSQTSFNNQIFDNVYLSAQISSSEINWNINIVQYAMILLFIIYLALIPLLVFLLKRFVGNPLNELNAAHRQLECGNEDYEISADANSAEFSTAYKSFNTMARSIQELHAEVINKELSNKQLQIDYLQLQIRPHFLLNSFNVLYTLIQRRQKDSAQEMVLFLSNYFRYLFRSGRELQLFSKERMLIEDYMNVSRIYYPDSFEVSYQIDPLIDLMRVPPLLLHSFMENIIAHALSPDRQVHIVFSGEYEDGIVTFYISDDGKGMSEEAIEAINHIDEQPIDDGKNVGIKNSIRRLKYYYGNAAKVECDSELNVGTTFTITIPYNLEVDGYDTFNCE